MTPGVWERSMTRRALLAKVKRVVLDIEPSARVFLYGSRARGRANVDSDWDFLILVDGSVDEPRKRRIRRRLYDIEWATGHVLTSIVLSHRDWSNGVQSGIPFHATVFEQGVAL